MTWVSLLITLLKLANNIMSYIEREKLMKAGADAEIAKISAAILKKTKTGKEIWEKVDAMGSDEVDAALRSLEPK
jgi:hypothetical protein